MDTGIGEKRDAAGCLNLAMPSCCAAADAFLIHVPTLS
jgi:hypothetical protein